MKNILLSSGNYTYAVGTVFAPNSAESQWWLRRWRYLCEPLS